MKKIKIICLVLILGNFGVKYRTLAQSKKTMKYYESAVIAYKNENFLLADSLFRISLKEINNGEILYFLAMTSLKLEKQCDYCSNLQKAKAFYHADAFFLYEKDCIKRDSVKYLSTPNENVFCYAIVENQICISKPSIHIYYKNKQDGIIEKFSIKDSYNYNIDEITNPKFDIAKLQSQFSICDFEEKMPEFSGGDMARIKFFHENIKYPQLDKENVVTGIVYVSFIVEPSGILSNIKITKGIGGGCDEEVIRVIKLMPRWIPATSNGIPIKSRFEMPVKFSIEKVNLR